MTEEKQSVQEIRNERGEVGVATSSLTIKQLWHRAHFSLVKANDKQHPGRKRLVENLGAPSLKQFARTLMKGGNEVALAWFANKSGENCKTRSESNVRAARESGLASKLARKATK